MSEKILKLGIPKGSLEKATFQLFEKAGFNISGSQRSYFPRIDDDEINLVMLRAQEMSRYVEDGVLDAGFTGFDWITENNSDVVEVCELLYSKATSKPANWVLAVPNESAVSSPQDLDGAIIATGTHLFGVPLFDDDFSTGSGVEIVRRSRGRDVKRHLVPIRQDRQRISADLVGRIAVGGDPVGPRDHRVDAAVTQDRGRGGVANHRDLDRLTPQLPGGQPRPLQ